MSNTIRSSVAAISARAEANERLTRELPPRPPTPTHTARRTSEGSARRAAVSMNGTPRPNTVSATIRTRGGTLSSSARRHRLGPTGLDVVAIHVLRRPNRMLASGPPAARDRVRRGCTERMLAVGIVDNGCEVRQAMMRREHRPLPRRIPRCIQRHSAKHEYPPVRSLEAAQREQPRRPSTGHAPSEPVEKSIPGTSVLRVHAEERAITRVGLEVLGEIQPRS